MSKQNEQMVSLGTYNGVNIMYRPSDGYVDTTLVCRAGDREWYKYRRTVGGTKYIESVAKASGRPKDTLIVTGPRVAGRGQHTLVDPRIALNCAAWVKPGLAAWLLDRLSAIAVASNTKPAPPAPKPTPAPAPKKVKFTEQQLAMLELAKLMVVMLDEIRELPGRLSASVVDYNQRLQNEPRRSYGGIPLSDTFRSPAKLRYADCRGYVLDICDWVYERYGTNPRTIYRILYNNVSNRLGWSVWDNYKAYQARYGGRYMDMVYEMGFARTLAQTAYDLFGNGQKPRLIEDSRATKSFGLTPRGERAGKPFTNFQNRPTMVAPVGRRRGRTEQPNQNAATAETKVQEFKQQQTKAAMSDRLDRDNGADQTSNTVTVPGTDANTVSAFLCPPTETGRTSAALPYVDAHENELKTLPATDKTEAPKEAFLAANV